MASRLPWAQAGHSYGWGHGNEFFHPKTKEQIQKEAMLQLAILAAVLVAPAIVDAGGGAGASAKKVAKKSTLRKFCSFIVMILMWQMTILILIQSKWITGDIIKVMQVQKDIVVIQIVFLKIIPMLGL